MNEANLTDALAALGRIFDKYELSDPANRNKNICMLAERNSICVMFAGSEMTGMGKIINRLTGRDLMPSGFEPVVEVAYGDEPLVALTDNAGNTAALDESSYDILKNLNEETVSRVSISVPADGILRNVKYYFCPLAGENRETVYKTAGLSDIFVILADAASLALEAERSLIAYIDVILCAREQCYVALNRIDAVPSRSTAISAVSAAFNGAYAGELLLETDSDLWEKWKPVQDKMLAEHFKSKPEKLRLQVKALAGDAVKALLVKMQEHQKLEEYKKSSINKLQKGRENYRLYCDNAKIDAKMILSLKIQDEFCTGIEAFGNAIKLGISGEIRKIDNRDDLLGFISPYINNLWLSFSEYEFVGIKSEISRNVNKIKDDLTRAFKDNFDFQLPEFSNTSFVRVSEMLKNMEHNYSVILEAATFNSLDVFINLFLLRGDIIAAALLKISKVLARYISEQSLLKLNDKNIRRISQKITEAIDEKLPDVITHYRDTVFPLFVQDVQDIVKESIDKTFECIDGNISDMKKELERIELEQKAVKDDIREAEQFV